MTPIYDAVNKTKTGTDCLGTVLLISSLTVIFSLICSTILGLLDLRRTRITPSEPIRVEENIQLTDILKFPLPLWLVFSICVTFYCTLFPFISVSKVFFISKYGFDPSQASGVSR